MPPPTKVGLFELQRSMQLPIATIPAWQHRFRITSTTRKKRCVVRRQRRSFTCTMYKQRLQPEKKESEKPEPVSPPWKRSIKKQLNSLRSTLVQHCHSNELN